MRKALFIQAAALAATLTGPAVSADLPMKSEAPYVQPRFSWTSCYLGGHVGGGRGSKAMTDPVFLVEENLIGAGTTTGVTTVNTTPTGAVIGGEIGCDYQFSSNVVVGIEGTASGSTMKGSQIVGLHDSPPDTALVQVNTDLLVSVTGRIGYAFDTVLIYGRGGFAMAGDKYNVSGGSVAGNGTPFDFLGVENRLGWVAGGGVDWAFTRHWSMNVEYDYYQFGNKNTLMADQVGTLTGVVNVKQSVQVV